MAVSTPYSQSKTYLTILFLLTIIGLPGCFSGQTETPEAKVVLQSRNLGEDSLHTTGVCSTATCEGEDCAASGCHRADSSNTPLVISGTVFQYQDLNLAYINSFAAIEFYSGPSGSGELIDALEVDTYGNFYSTEPITTLVYPALRYEDNQGNVRHAYMPRPVAPRAADTCNACHQLAQPSSTLPDPADLYYLRISNAMISNSNPNIDYHPNGDKGPNCLDGTCHGAGVAATSTVFTMAGLVMEGETNTAYSLGDAAFGLFPEECDDQRYGCQSSVAKEDVVFRTRAAKTYLEINRRGHFYTTQPINWNLDTYPTLANYDPDTHCRNIKHMVSTIPAADAGNCYSCHDGTTQALINITGKFNPDEKCERDFPTTQP